MWGEWFWLIIYSIRESDRDKERGKKGVSEENDSDWSCMVLERVIDRKKER